MLQIYGENKFKCLYSLLNDYTFLNTLSFFSVLLSYLKKTDLY